MTLRSRVNQMGCCVLLESAHHARRDIPSAIREEIIASKVRFNLNLGQEAGY